MHQQCGNTLDDVNDMLTAIISRTKDSLFQENQDVVHVSEFIRFNVCGRLIQGAAKRPRAFFTSAEKKRQGENARINAYQKDRLDREKQRTC